MGLESSLVLPTLIVGRVPVLDLCLQPVSRDESILSSPHGQQKETLVGRLTTP